MEKRHGKALLEHLREQVPTAEIRIGNTLIFYCGEHLLDTFANAFLKFCDQMEKYRNI